MKDFVRGQHCCLKSDRTEESRVPAARTLVSVFTHQPYELFQRRESLQFSWEMTSFMTCLASADPDVAAVMRSAEGRVWTDGCTAVRNE